MRGHPGFGVIALAALTLAALAGCGSGAPAEYRVGGAFKSSRTAHDFDDLRATAAPYGGDVAILESFPEQFGITGLDSRCDELRGKLVQKVYLASASPCARQS